MSENLKPFFTANGNAVMVSTVLSATDTKTHDYDLDGIIHTIRSGGKNIRARVEAIRKTFRSELDKHGDIKLAKGAIDSAKKQLPAVVWSGTFTERANDKIVNSSGLLCADLDNLGTRLKEVREKLTRSPNAWAVFLSPSGDGLKVVFRVPADKSKHSGSFLAIEQYVKETVDVQVDQSCKDVARLCFLSYDPQIFHNPSAIEIEPLPEDEKPQYVPGANIDLNARQQVVNEILVAVDWESETSGFTTCPGKHLHTTGNGDRDCKIDLDQVPTVHCFHNSCRGILNGVNHEIRSQIAKAECENSKADDNPEADEWPEPQPLVMDTKSEPYPLDALPETVHAAVNEVQQFTKAPVALVASSALAALSAAIQAHVDIKRAEMLSGPVGLFLLTIADSGERKSTCDRLFSDEIRRYEAERAEAAKPEVKKYKAASDAWEARRAGIKDKIRQLAKEKKPIDEYERTLWDLEKEKPQAPKIPRLIYTDATPEALKWKLATGWPSAAVICAEAGIVFGSHSMGQDSIMRNLTTLNELWDGRPISTDRRTTESFTVRGARLTLGLQVQEATLRSFFDRSNGLPRGTGFMARFLIAWPESTQGSRHFTEPPSNSPGLSAFNRSISNILNKAVAVDDDGALTPPMLGLTPAAKTAWVTFHDKIESQLASGGELYDVRDVASKSADNAVRLSALLQVFEKGPGESLGPVEVEAFENASRIVAWHLNESRRFFGELALPVELVNAAHLDNWLIEYCRRKRTKVVTTRTVQQLGPARLRDKKVLDSALSELEELDRARTAKDGRRRIITINPALIEGSNP